MLGWVIITLWKLGCHLKGEQWKQVHGTIAESLGSMQHTGTGLVTTTCHYKHNFFDYTVLQHIRSKYWKKLWVMGQHPLTHDPCDPSNNGDPWPTDPSPTLGRGPSPPRPLLTVPNVTPHPSTASVPVFLYDGPLLCVFNVPVEGLMLMHRQNVMHYILRLIYSPNCKQHYLGL